MSAKVLLVDDDAAILDVTCRSLMSATTAPERAGAPAFSIETAGTAADALALLAANGPYAVIVTDYTMPGMNGVEFLERVRAIEASTVRMLLTSHADVHMAIDAVNCGAVFRFLTKPCPPRILTSAIVVGLQQYQLIHAERQVLEQTVGGIVEVLTEILTLINPTAACRAQRMRRYVQHMVRRLDLPNRWQLEAAAMLSHLGCLTFSMDSGDAIGGRSGKGDAISPALQDHPALTQALLAHVPRFGGVAAIIAAQREPVDPRDVGTPLRARDEIRLGGQVLRVAIEFDVGLSAGLNRADALARLRHRPAEFEPELVHSLGDVALPSLTLEAQRVALGALRAGMVLDEDLRNEGGLLLMSRGQEITVPMLARLQSVAPKDWLATKVTVLTPQLAGGESLPS